MAQSPLQSPYGGSPGWIDARLPIPRLLDRECLKFRVPRNLNYFWRFGGILMISLMLLIVTGIVLAMHYKPSADEAFCLRRAHHA